MLQENTLFANRYQLIKLLGRGGFSEVWLAKDNWTHLQIAIKVYAPGQGMDQDGLQDFCGELASVYDLNHSNLLKPQHVDTWQNMPYLIMAYCPAGSCVKRIGKMTEPELWKLIHDVAAGLAYLHEKDVIHQDIKPDNILIDTEGNYLITDFGISTRARSTLRKSVIGGNTSGGTTAYMGPERFSRQPAPTKASDIWSFGAMAFELLEGVTPFGEIGGGMQKGGAEIPFINAPVSDALKFTIFKMLSKETWDRPTAATLVEWANNPNAIEVDYDLLTDNDDSPQYPATPVAKEDSEGRETQRFGTSSAHNNTNATVTLGAAVSEELTISVNPEEIYVLAEGGNAIVYVNTNGEWTLPKATTQDWIRTTKYSDNAFTIKFDKNKTGKERAYTLVVPAVNNGTKAFANIAIKQPSVKSKAWIWWILLPIIGMTSVVGISNYNERKRYEEQQRQEQRQEQSRRSEIQSRYDEKIERINSLIRQSGVNNIEELITARYQVKDLQTIEKQNPWIEKKSKFYNDKVENKCVEIDKQLYKSSNTLAAKVINGELYFNDVHTEIYDLLDKQYKLFPTDQLKKARDSWK
ncbi:MAG: protein kinase [Paludibacteraceae bacterium]|nr:protein kinase [Paludibacteraceae bacterium]